MDEPQSRSPVFNQWQPEPVWDDLLNWSAEDIGLKDIKD